MKFVIGLIGFLVAAPAFANPFAELNDKTPVCFERVYSQDHMDSHPLQTVKEMTMKYRQNAQKYGQGMVILDIKAMIKKPINKSEYNYKPYSNSMGCFFRDGQLNCGIDCDGGTATVKWDVQSENSQEITFVNKGFVMYGGCGSDVDENDMIWLNPKKGGDDIFKLRRMPTKSCRGLKIGTQF